MVDLTTFVNNPDNERFETTMQSTRTAGVKNLYLSGKGIPKYPHYQDLVNASERYISDNRNIEAVIKQTYGGASPALSFLGEWVSNSSHVLAYFELDNEDWLDNSELPPEPQYPDFVFTTDTNFETTTSQTLTLSSDIEEGDLLLLSGFVRSSVSVPTGWTEVISVYHQGGTYDQHLFVYKKIATVSDIGSSVTVSQSVSNRMSCNVSVFRHSDGLDIGNSESSVGYISEGVLSSPTVSPNKNYSLLFSASSVVFATTSGTNTYEAPVPWSQLTPSLSSDTSNQIRFGAAYTPADVSDNLSCLWSQNIDRYDSSCGNVVLSIERAS